jgi:hypothetical protein
MLQGLLKFEPKHRLQLKNLRRYEFFTSGYCPDKLDEGVIWNTLNFINEDKRKPEVEEDTANTKARYNDPYCDTSVLYRTTSSIEANLRAPPNLIHQKTRYCHCHHCTLFFPPLEHTPLAYTHYMYIYSTLLHSLINIIIMWSVVLSPVKVTVLLLFLFVTYMDKLLVACWISVYDRDGRLVMNVGMRGMEGEYIYIKKKKKKDT